MIFIFRLNMPLFFQLLLKLIVDHLADFIAAPDVLSMFIEQLKKTYYIILIRPECLGKWVKYTFQTILNLCWMQIKSNFSCAFRDVRLQILEHHRWSVMQKYEAIMADLSVDDLMTFANRFKAELFVEGLIQGNFTSAVRFFLRIYFSLSKCLH